MGLNINVGLSFSMANTLDMKMNVLEAAIELEKDTLQFYKKIVNIVKDDNIKKLYKRLTDDEQNHIKRLTEEQKRIENYKKVIELKRCPQLKKGIEEILNNRLKSVQQFDFNGSVNNNLLILEGIEQEIDGCCVYGLASKTIKDQELKDIFRFLLSSEERHLIILEGEFYHLKNFHEPLNPDKFSEKESLLVPLVRKKVFNRCNSKK